METLLVFLAIIAIQMIAAYAAKQKKEAAKTAKSPLPSWQQQTQNPPKETHRVVNHPPKEEPDLDEAPVEVKKKESIIEEEKPILNSQLSTLNSKIDLKDPAQGILWAAILHEPRYKARWKRR